MLVVVQNDNVFEYTRDLLIFTVNIIVFQDCIADETTDLENDHKLIAAGEVYFTKSSSWSSVYKAAEGTIY